MNRKGQVLVAFILIIPIIIAILGISIELGLNYNEKTKMNNVVEDAISYYFVHVSDPEVENNINKLLLKNIDDVTDKQIVITDGYITISITKVRSSSLLKIIGQKDYEIKTKYKGYLDNNKIIMEKE